MVRFWCVVWSWVGSGCGVWSGHGSGLTKSSMVLTPHLLECGSQGLHPVCGRHGMTPTAQGCLTILTAALPPKPLM